MAEKRYMPCPGGTIGLHMPCVFLEIEKCKKPNAVTMHCSLCGFRAFAYGPAWHKYGFSASAAKSTCPQGVAAVDGTGTQL